MARRHEDKDFKKNALHCLDLIGPPHFPAIKKCIDSPSLQRRGLGGGCPATDLSEP